MKIEPGQFILFWAGGLIVVVALIFGRPRRRGMILRLTGPRRRANPVVARDPTPVAAGERSLNVIFQFNGHSWDAYEVLGVPAGSKFDEIRRAFDAAVATVDPTSRPFVESAFRAITDALARD